MDNAGLKEKLRKFIGKHVKNAIEDDLNLIRSGLVNSLFAIQLVLFVENQFKIKVENEDLDLKNFSSINAMAAFIESKAGK